LYRRPNGGTVADAFATTPISIPLLTEAQGEAIGFDPKGWGYYTTSEGANPSIYYFDRLPHGDYNHNGTVDAGDYVVWRKGLGATYVSGDVNTWRSNFGLSAAASGLSTTVPEPASVILLLGGFLLVLQRARR
jgi:hypothetical protein